MTVFRGLPLRGIGLDRLHRCRKPWNQRNL